MTYCLCMVYQHITCRPVNEKENKPSGYEFISTHAVTCSAISPVIYSIQANMEGKTKEKLESMGLAFLILSLRYSNPMDAWGKHINALLNQVRAGWGGGGGVGGQNG